MCGWQVKLCDPNTLSCVKSALKGVTIGVIYQVFSLYFTLQLFTTVAPLGLGGCSCKSCVTSLIVNTNRSDVVFELWICRWNSHWRNAGICAPADRQNIGKAHSNSNRLLLDNISLMHTSNLASRKMPFLLFNLNFAFYKFTIAFRILPWSHRVFSVPIPDLLAMFGADRFVNGRWDHVQTKTDISQIIVRLTPEMCPHGQVLGLEDPWGQNAVALASDIKSLALALAVKSLASSPWPWPWKSSITTFSFGLSYCLHFSVNELMKVQVIVVGLLFSV